MKKWTEKRWRGGGVPCLNREVNEGATSKVNSRSQCQAGRGLNVPGYRLADHHTSRIFQGGVTDYEELLIYNYGCLGCC
jgi:hypothetical protein